MQLVAIAWFCVYILRQSGISYGICCVNPVLSGVENLGSIS